MCDTPDPTPPCSHCSSHYSERYCEDCSMYLCLYCSIDIHQPIGKRDHYCPRLFGLDFIENKGIQINCLASDIQSDEPDKEFEYKKYQQQNYNGIPIKNTSSTNNNTNTTNNTNNNNNTNKVFSSLHSFISSLNNNNNNKSPSPSSLKSES